MAKWYGIVGYAIPEETSPGVWKEKLIKRNHTGDVIRFSSRWSQSSETTNDDLTINNQISILVDPFAYDNFRWMKYVEFMGTEWKITNIEFQYPRLTLTIGGVYNGR